MAFGSPFKRSSAQAPVEQSSSGDDLVIDAEADEVIAEPGVSPVPRDAAVPQAAAPQAVQQRSERELAVRNVAVATAGGLVAGAATIAVATIAKSAAKHAVAPTPGLSRRRKKDILESQSFLIDVHTLKPGR